MELAEFLRARLDDVERTAGNYVRFEVRDGVPGNYAIRDEVLREVEAKRRILEQYEAMQAGAEAAAGTILAGLAKVRLGAYEVALKCLALPYADAPGYREEWWPV